MGTKCAEQCIALGYNDKQVNELGYQTFLYGNEIELRRIFMFLIDKLPKGTKFYD